MPTDSIVTAISGAATDLRAVLPPLEAAVTEIRAPGGGGRRTQPGSRPPWNPQIAYILTGIFAGIRDLEHDLQYRIAGVTRHRGGSDGNTYRCLEAIVSLAAGADESDQRGALTRMTRWTWQSRVALGEAEPWQQLPRLPGQPPARCYECRFTTLRYKATSGMIRCLNPACQDADGYRIEGQIMIGQVSGEPIIAWRDGSTGL